MIKFSFDIKKIFSRIPFFTSDGRFGVVNNRIRDWQIILWATLVLVIVILIINLTLFYRISAGTIFRNISEDDKAVQTIDREALQKAVSMIQQEQTQFSTTLSQKPNTSNPAR